MEVVARGLGSEQWRRARSKDTDQCEPEEVEEALKLLDSVIDANVVGVPDPKWGSAVTAIVQLADGATVTDRDLVDSLRSQLSGYKLPKHVVRVDRMFRSPNGKSDYKWAVRTAREVLEIN